MKKKKEEEEITKGTKSGKRDDSINTALVGALDGHFVRFGETDIRPRVIQSRFQKKLTSTKSDLYACLPDCVFAALLFSVRSCVIGAVSADVCEKQKLRKKSFCVQKNDFSA